MDPSISRSIEWIKNLRDSTTIIVAPCSGRGIVRDWGLWLNKGSDPTCFLPGSEEAMSWLLVYIRGVTVCLFHSFGMINRGIEWSLKMIISVLAKFGLCSICSQNLDASSHARAHQIFAIARMLGFLLKLDCSKLRKSCFVARFCGTELNLSLRELLWIWLLSSVENARQKHKLTYVIVRI